MGIEPIVSAWKANRLPLTDTRKLKFNYGKDGIRTHGPAKDSNLAN